MTTRNKYGCGAYGFREFRDFKFDLEVLYFCMKCVQNPAKNKISRLLNLCIKKEADRADVNEMNDRYERRRKHNLDNAWNLIYTQEERLRNKKIYFPNNDYEEKKENE